MDVLPEDTMPLAALSIGQAKTLIGGLIADQLCELKNPTTPKVERKERLTTEEAIDYLIGCAIPLTKAGIYKMHCEGQIPAVRVGKRLVFDRSELDAWIKSRERIRPTRTETVQNLARSAGRKRSGRASK